MSIQNFLLRLYLKKNNNYDESRPWKSVAAVRRLADKPLEKVALPKEAIVKRDSVEGLPVYWISMPESDPHKVLLYLHGGGYVAGSYLTHNSLAARLAQHTGFTVLLPEYRLAPEFPFPHGVNDAVACYEWLLRKPDIKTIILGGDSAGGGLSLSAALKLSEEKIKMPEALMLLAPWIDLTMSSPTLEEVANKDPLLKPVAMKRFAEFYYQQADPTNPYLSPLFGNFKGLPKTIIQTGTHDVLIGESRDLAERMKRQGVEVVFIEGKGMIHVWQFLYHILPEARKAVKQLGEFARSI